MYTEWKYRLICLWLASCMTAAYTTPRNHTACLKTSSRTTKRLLATRNSNRKLVISYYPSRRIKQEDFSTVRPWKGEYGISESASNGLCDFYRISLDCSWYSGILKTHYILSYIDTRLFLTIGNVYLCIREGGAPTVLMQRMLEWLELFEREVIKFFLWT